MNSHVNTKNRSLADGLSLPITITLVSLNLLIVVWFFANQWYQGQLIAEQKSHTSAVLSLTANTLSAELNRRLALLDGLYAYVIAEPTEQDMKEHYEAFAEALSANTSGVRNIAAAPGGIMQYIYPHKGNEQALGYDPLLDTRPEVLKNSNLYSRTSLFTQIQSISLRTTSHWQRKERSSGEQR